MYTVLCLSVLSYYFKDRSDYTGHLVPVTNETITRWQAGLTRCFKAGVNAGTHQHVDGQRCRSQPCCFQCACTAGCELFMCCTTCVSCQLLKLWAFFQHCWPNSAGQQCRLRVSAFLQGQSHSNRHSDVCLAYAVVAGFTTVHIVLHVNFISEEMHGKSLWRNGVKFNPAAK